VKVLIIGGTRFLGRALVDSALVRGHDITLFNRGQSNPDLFPQVEKLRGNRENEADLGVLAGRRWDVVIDTCGYVPRHVRNTAKRLADQVDRYMFISTISVYSDSRTPGQDETASLGMLQDDSTEEITGETYGPLKVLCERAAEGALPGRTLIIRPGLIVGPHDPTDRFTYWPVRLDRGGDVLAPGEPEVRTQIIDVRDLADWTIRMAEAKETGVFNATGPQGGLSMGEVIETCRHAASHPSSVIWVPEAFLVRQEVGPWMELPLWLQEADRGLMAVKVNKAVQAGLTFRPLADTVRDTLVWAQTRLTDHQWRAGISPEKERQVLDAWKERTRTASPTQT
jgi:2'-hydroxyisoflavone reductase